MTFQMYVFSKSHFVRQIKNMRDRYKEKINSFSKLILYFAYNY